MPPRALVAIDHDLLAQGLAAVLRSETGIAAETAGSAAVRVRPDDPAPGGAYDVVLVDTDGHDDPGGLIGALHACGVRVVVLADSDAAHGRAATARPAGIIRTDQPDTDVSQVVLEVLSRTV